MRRLRALQRRLRAAWYLAQARMLIAGVNRRQAARQRLRQPCPGYDELRSPWFLGTMILAFLVLVIDIGDHWGAVLARLAGAISGA